MKGLGRKSWGILPLFFLIPLFGSSFGSERGHFSPQKNRVAPALLEELSFLDANPGYDYAIPVIVKLQAGAVDHRLSRANALRSVGGYAAKLTGRQISDLLDSGALEYLTLDAVIRPTFDLRSQARGSWEGELNPNLRTMGVDLVEQTGEGVVVALFDSGIGHHPDLTRQQIVAAVDFTSGDAQVNVLNKDGHGHGTAIAGVIGGSGRSSAGYFRGVAPGVRFVDLKVIGDDGTGLTSDLIRAIDWVIENRTRYGIRLANLSIGHPSVESYQDDPLCEAVGRLVESGVMTFASAGNLGKTEQFPEIWGGITSPGNHPAVVTVSALNTNSTAAHADDLAATYASRGPALQDGIFKPDLTAPGDAIPVLAGRNSWLTRELRARRVADYPQYLYLGGSSIAAAFATGTAALMLEANPEMNVNMMRYLLLLSAVKLDQPHLLEQGNGLVNTKTAVDLAAALDMEARAFSYVPKPYWELDGEEVWVGGAFAFADKLYLGFQLQLPSFQFWGSGLVWAENILKTDQVIWVDGSFWTDQVIWIDQAFWTDQVIWVDQALWTDQVIWIDQALWADQVIWVDQTLWTDQIIWVDQIRSFDQVIWVDQILSNDQVIWIDSLFSADQVIWIDQNLTLDQIVWTD